MTPYISADDGKGRVFGCHFDGTARQDDRFPFTPASLSGTGDAFKKAASSIAVRYAEAEAAAIFRRITSDSDSVSFVSFEAVGDDFFFGCKASRGAPLTLATRDGIRDVVRGGGKTWDCGEFGDITATVAQAVGFTDFWYAMLGPVVKEPHAVRIRLSLADTSATLAPE